MRRLAALLAVAAALLFAAPLAATIYPQKGMAGVTLAVSQKRVRAILGAPARVERGMNEFGRYTEFRYPGLRIFFQGNTGVTNVSTTRRSERTPGGIGVGSTERELRRKLGGETCKTEFGFRHCYLGKFLPGRRVTDFVIRRGRVVRVSVGLVID